MQARLEGENDQGLKQYLTANAWNEYTKKGSLKLKGTSNPHFTGYNIKKSSVQANNRFLYEVNLQSAYYGQPYADNSTEGIVVQFNGGQYLVAGAELINRITVLNLNKTLKLKSTDKTEQLLKITQLPNEFSPQGASTETRFGFGKDDFGILAISSDNKKVAFGTRGIHSGLGWLDITNTRQSKLNLLDLLFESNINVLVFSVDGHYLAVEYNGPTGNKGVRVYDTERNKLMDFGINNSFPPDKYSLSLKYWDYSNLKFQVSPGEGIKDVDQNDLGNWELNTQTGEIMKLLE